MKPSASLAQFIINNNQYDQKIYDYASMVNEKFKKECQDFTQEVLKAKKQKIISYFLNWPMIMVYKLSNTLKKHSKIYFKFLNFIDNKIK